MENGGRFTDGQVDQQRCLGGWSVTSGVVHLDVKKIIEEYSNNAGLITNNSNKTMISTYSTLRTTGFLGTTHNHLLKTAVLKKVMNIG